MTSFSDLQAKDLMKTDVVSFSPETSIEAAISTFEDLHISGAPVVNAYGTLVGVLSAFDVVRTEHVAGSRIETGRGDPSMGYDDDEGEFFDPEEVILIRDDYSPAVRGAETVGDWMSAGVVTVSPEDSIQKVCAAMAKGHFHRMCVVKDEKLVGIVTSFDIVRAVAEEK
jgi:CBS domain-containing protein